MNDMKQRMTRFGVTAATTAGSLALIPGCLHIKTDPIEVKPITLNVNLRVQRELDDFFSFENQIPPATSPAATRPST